MRHPTLSPAHESAFVAHPLPSLFVKVVTISDTNLNLNQTHGQLMKCICERRVSSGEQRWELNRPHPCQRPTLVVTDAARSHRRRALETANSIPCSPLPSLPFLLRPAYSHSPSPPLGTSALLELLSQATSSQKQQPPKHRLLLRGSRSFKTPHSCTTDSPSYHSPIFSDPVGRKQRNFDPLHLLLSFISSLFFIH